MDHLLPYIKLFECSPEEIYESGLLRLRKIFNKKLENCFFIVPDKRFNNIFRLFFHHSEQQLLNGYEDEIICGFKFPVLVSEPYNKYQVEYYNSNGPGKTYYTLVFNMDRLCY